MLRTPPDAVREASHHEVPRARLRQSTAAPRVKTQFFRLAYVQSYARAPGPVGESTEQSLLGIRNSELGLSGKKQVITSTASCKPTPWRGKCLPGALKKSGALVLGARTKARNARESKENQQDLKARIAPLQSELLGPMGFN